MSISLIATVLVGIVAALHVWFLVLEMFLWKTATGRRTFGTTQTFAEESAKLAANQGLYNGFLAAGLVWGLVSPGYNLEIKTFFLACVIVAGVYGAITVKPLILFVQALPAAVALGLFWLFHA